MKNQRLVKNYIYNTLYQILILIAPLITIPYVSRVLGVTNIGVYNYSQSIATYFVLIGAVGTSLYGQREIAYLQEKPVERTKVFWQIEVFRAVVVMVCSLVYFFVFCNHRQYSTIYRILTIEVLATAFDISWFFMGMENFKLIVIRNVIIKLTGIACVFIFVKSKADTGLYTACMTIPILIGNFSLWFSLKKNLEPIRFDGKELFCGIKKRIRPIFILFLPQIAMDVYLVLDKTMIGLLATDIAQVGYYSQAQKIVKLILTIITSLGTVMLPAMSAAYARGDNKGIINSVCNAFRFSYMLSFALMFGLCAVSYAFVPIFFGQGYDLVAPLILIISPILVIIATSNVIGKQFLLPTNQQRAFTISIIVGALANFLLNLLLIPKWNAVGASVATIIAELAVTGTQCVFVRDQLPLKKCLTAGLRYLLLGVIMYFAVKGIQLCLPKERILSLLIMIVFGVIVYIGELLLTKDPMLQYAKKVLK